MPTTSPQRAAELETWSPFRRVLAATSLDEPGTRAALRAARLPLAPGARVSLLHVLRPWSAPSARPSAAREARRALQRLAASATDAAVAAGNEEPEVVPRVSEGWPAIEIVRAAWQDRAELIVLGPPAARFDGSARKTIFRVMRHADLPLLVARSDPGRAYRQVLCAVDRSAAAVDPIALAARLARPTALGFTLLHAYHVPFEPWLRSGAPEIEGEAIAEVRALARAIRDEVATVRARVRRGDPCFEILRAAVRERADLIAVGTHGRTGLARAILGSSAEWIIENSPFDVAVARPHRRTLERR